MSNKSIICFFFIATALVASMMAIAGVKEEVSARTAPVGKVCMSGEPCAAAAVQVASGPRSGDELYNSKCVACHSTGAAGAPRLGDSGQWTARLNKGIETLYKNAINGIGGMPAKGLCMDCSEDEIRSTVDYILVKSQ